MIIFLYLAGGLMALVGFLNGSSFRAESAMQQTVQYLSYVVGCLGLVVLALGVVAAEIRQGRKAP